MKWPIDLALKAAAAAAFVFCVECVAWGGRRHRVKERALLRVEGEPQAARFAEERPIAA